MASRMTMISSAMAGRPSIHSWRETLPSFTARLATMEVSSQWHRTGSSSRLAWMRASRIRLALSTLHPSSDRAMAPAFFRASASVSSPPCSPTDTAPMGYTWTPQAWDAFSRIYWICSGVSTVGLVFAMQATAVTPPRAAAAVPVKISSL